MDRAQFYEIELYEMLDGKDDLRIYEKARTREPDWSKQVPPGKYQFRLRGLDSREVPGEWSDYSLIDVRLPRPIYIHPLANDILKGIEDTEEKIVFEWKEVEGAAFYIFEIWNKEGFRFQKKVYEHSLSHPLVVAKKYNWRVLPMISETDEIPPTVEEGGVSFFLQGKELNAPQVESAIKNQKLYFNWTRTVADESYEIEMFWLAKNNKWTRVSHNYNYLKTALVFQLSKLSGEYRFTIRSHKEGHKESAYTFMEFEVRADKSFKLHKQRSQATSDLKNSNPFFYSLGYEYLTINYESDSNERDTRLSTSLTGQKLIGEFAYQDFYSVWKHRLNIEVMKAAKLGQSKTLFEADYLLGQVIKWKYAYTELFGGLFYRDNLFIEADRFNNQFEFQTIPTLGPMISVRPMFVLNRRFDLGLDLKAFYNLFATSTPSNESVKATLSYKARLALTFHYKEETTWSLFSGYYMDSVSYKAGTGSGSIATPGSYNKSNSSGYSLGILMNSFI